MKRALLTFVLTAALLGLSSPAFSQDNGHYRGDARYGYAAPSNNNSQYGAYSPYAYSGDRVSRYRDNDDRNYRNSGDRDDRDSGYNRRPGRDAAIIGRSAVLGGVGGLIVDHAGHHDGRH